MEPWKTEIAYSSETETLIRGYDLESLIKNRTFTEIIYLLLRGDLPSKNQAKVLDAMLVAAAEHGIAPPSITSARLVASGGAAFNSAVAAGILALGEFHGGAIEGCAKMLQENNNSAEEIVADFKKQGKRIPGFGHKIYTEDPRTISLIGIAKKQKISGKFTEKALEIEKELEISAGRKLCLNIDGIMAALLSDMGFDWRLANGFFVIARAPGLVAHVYEEKTKEKPFRRLEEGKDYEYIGPKKKK
ncbi:MAG TPA: citryl-CoA lyase [Candidatus Nanoarchaeia archaeon]|nr:citryl-CoA lyase [Candidatus Nanoarchaeia archaeon]